MSAASGAPKRAVRVSRGTRFRVTMMLALMLALVGVAGAGATSLLLRATRPATSDDIAQLVCTTYSTQNYDSLLDAVDPTPLPPSAGPFDTAAKAALRKRLQALDAAGGAVTKCAYKGPLFPDLTKANTQKQYLFTMQRAHVTNAITMPMTMVHQADGSWKLSRGSDFTGLPAA